MARNRRFCVYERPPLAGGATAFVHTYDRSEIPAMKEIAGHFKYDRLHMDPQVSNDDADEFKRSMIDNAIANDWPIMTCGEPLMGFLIVRPEIDIAHIDLLGIHPDYRGRRVGVTLVLSFLDWTHKNKFQLCRAGTMLTNAAARKLYQTLGFREFERMRTFHY